MRTTRNERQVGDDAVRNRTGRSWEQWFGILDKMKAMEKPHRDIARELSEKFPDIGGWWIQTITVTYEQERGLRDKHQKPGGYEISVGKVIHASVGRVYEYWENPDRRSEWLPGEEITIRKSTPFKSMRITWSDGTTSLAVYFYEKGDIKSQVVVQHIKLRSRHAAEGKKKYWKSKLEALKKLCSGE